MNICTIVLQGPHQIGTWWCKGKNCQCTPPPMTLALQKMNWSHYLQCLEVTTMHKILSFETTLISSFFSINVCALFNLVFVFSMFVGVLVFCFSAWRVFEEILKIVLFYYSLEDCINLLELCLFFLFLKFLCS